VTDRRHDLPFLDRRGFLALAGTLLLTRRKAAISHFVPCGMFRGDHRRTGFYDTPDVSDDAELERFFAAGGKREKVVASPLLVGDLVCAGVCTVRNIVLRRKRPHTFYAVDIRTGKARWQFDADKGIVGSAAYHGDTILVGSLDGRLHAYDLDGRRKWVFRAEGGILGSVAVYDGCAVFAAGDMDGGRIYCLDIESRRLRWRPVEMPAGPFASPCIAGGNVFLGTYWSMKKDSFFYVVDVGTGEVKKVVELSRICFCSTAASDGETVYFADCGEWVRPSIFYAWDARTAEEKWRLEIDADNIASSISLIGDLAVFGCDRGYLYAVNTRERRLAWKSAHRSGGYHGSPCATPGRIYIGSKRRRLHLFDHDGNHLRDYEAGGIIESTPVVRDGQLFIGCNDGYLYRLAAPSSQPKSNAG